MDCVFVKNKKKPRITSCKKSDDMFMDYGQTKAI